MATQQATVGKGNYAKVYKKDSHKKETTLHHFSMEDIVDMVVKHLTKCKETSKNFWHKPKARSRRPCKERTSHHFVIDSLLDISLKIFILDSKA